MPMTDASSTPRPISVRHLADAVQVNATPGEPYRLADGFGVTYTGTPAHLALAALCGQHRLSESVDGETT